MKKFTDCSEKTGKFPRPEAEKRDIFQLATSGNRLSPLFLWAICIKLSLFQPFTEFENLLGHITGACPAGIFRIPGVPPRRIGMAVIIIDPCPTSGFNVSPPLCPGAAALIVNPCPAWVPVVEAPHPGAGRSLKPPQTPAPQGFAISLPHMPLKRRSLYNPLRPKGFR